MLSRSRGRIACERGCCLPTTHCGRWPRSGGARCRVACWATPFRRCATSWCWPLPGRRPSGWCASRRGPFATCFASRATAGRAATSPPCSRKRWAARCATCAWPSGTACCFLSWMMARGFNAGSTGRVRTCFGWRPTDGCVRRFSRMKPGGESQRWRRARHRRSIRSRRFGRAGAPTGSRSRRPWRRPSRCSTRCWPKRQSFGQACRYRHRLIAMRRSFGVSTRPDAHSRRNWPVPHPDFTGSIDGRRTLR